MSYFIPSLIEETHSELSSSLKGANRASFCEILTVEPESSKSFIRTKFLPYQISVKNGAYEPDSGDIIALTDIKPKTVQDFNRPRRYYHIAYVHGLKERTNKISILSYKSVDMEIGFRRNNATKLYAVYLMNLTTNIRVWKALNSELKGANMNMIEKVLKADSNVRISKFITKHSH